jgi:3',5'-cyclic AMP phosphodiesterase CpdA
VGLGQGPERTTGREPLWGKRWALDLFGSTAGTAASTAAGGTSSCSTASRAREGYTAKLDDEQFDWLAKDLAAEPGRDAGLRAVAHPDLSVTPYLDGRNEKTGDWVVPGAWMHIDARRIVDLFRKHPNVKLCLSGHEHQYDRCLYNDVWYVCNGAVCGNWWKGDYLGTPPGYGPARPVRRRHVRRAVRGVRVGGEGVRRLEERTLPGSRGRASLRSRGAAAQP